MLILLIAVLLIPIALQLFAKRLDIFDPSLVFSLFMFLGYVMPYDRIGTPDDIFPIAWPYQFFNFGLARDTAVRVALVASIGFLVAYYSVLHITVARTVRRVDTWRQPHTTIVSYVYVLLGLGLVAVGIYQIGGFGTLLANLGDRIRLFAGLNYYFAGVNLVLVAGFVAWIRFLTGARRSAPVLLLLFSLVIASLLGNRATVIVYVIACAVAWHWLRRTISGRTMAVGALGALTCLVILQIALREYLAVGELVTVDFSNPWSFVDAATRELRGNFIQLQVLTVIVDAAPDPLPLQFGSTFLATLQIAIPSAWWANKPLTAAGILTTSIWPLRWSELGTTLPPGLIGELYMNFQTIGVFVGMILVGALYGASKGFASSGKLSRVGTHAILVGLLGHYLRGETAGPTVLLGVLLIPFLIAMRLSIARPNLLLKNSPQESRRRLASLSVAVPRAATTSQPGPRPRAFQ